jgi:hypothetical protein
MNGFGVSRYGPVSFMPSPTAAIRRGTFFGKFANRRHFVEGNTMPVLDRPSTTRRAGRRAIKATLAGSLRGDLSAAATKLQEALHRCDITVWTNAASEILFDRADTSPQVGPEWLAGTYGVGASAGDIEADLVALRRECIPTAILD